MRTEQLPALELSGISKSFRIGGRKTSVLNRLNLSVRRGELVSITGQSGCGKSTLLNIIAGIVRAEGGTVRLFGKRIHRFWDVFSSRVRNRRFGYIFQTFRLLPDESVLSNVLLPARIRGKVGPHTRSDALRLLKELGIDRLRHMKAGVLSGGQKQRAAIARAMVNRPDIILADEPTANLDRETSLEIGRILSRLTKQGFTIIAVTHQDYLFRHSDRVLRLKNGRLEAVRI